MKPDIRPSRARLLTSAALGPFVMTAEVVGLTALPSTPAMAQCITVVDTTCFEPGATIGDVAAGLNIIGAFGTTTVTSGSVATGVTITSGSVVNYTNTGPITVGDPGANGIFVLSGGTVTLNANDDIAGGANANGILTTPLLVENVNINNNGNTIQGGVAGIGIFANNDINIDNGGMFAGGTGGSAFLLSLGGNVDYHGGSAITTDGAAILGAALDGNVNIGAFDDWAAADSENGPGILGLASGDVTIHAGAVKSGPNGPITTGIPVIDALSSVASGGVLGLSTGGNVDITTHDKISTTGNFGAMGVSLGGSATVTVDGAIDPPMLVGAGTLTFGPGAATTTVNVVTEALAIGAFAGNFGAGDVTIDADAALSADGIGALAFTIGDGATDVDIAGAIGGYSTDATADDGVLVYSRFGAGDTDVDTHAGASIEAGDDGIDVFMAHRDGDIKAATGDDVMAVDQGIIVKRKHGTGDTEVGVGANSESHVVSTGGNGVKVRARFTDGDIIASVFEDSSVVAETGSALDIRTSDDAGGSSNDVDIFNAGALSGKGAEGSRTIRVKADGFVSIFNDAPGTIGAVSGAADAEIMRVRAGLDVGAVNVGEMTGRVDLVSREGDVTVKNIYGSGGIWDTSGRSVFRAAGDATLDNLQVLDGKDAVINTFDTTRFAFFSDGTSMVRNSGIVNVTGTARFGTRDGHLDDFYNHQGLINMVNGVSRYDKIITPNYESGVGDRTIITGNFRGGKGSTYAIDATIASPGLSSSDLMTIGGKVEETTTLKVNNLGKIPAGSNQKGIPVVEVLSGDTKAGDFKLDGGPIDTGLFAYDLYLDKNPGETLSGSPDTKNWVLASVPNQRAFELAAITSGLEALWNEGATTWHDRTADLRRIVPGAPSEDQRTGVWVNAFGSTFDRDKTDRATIFGVTSAFDGDYDQTMSGFIFGMDRTGDLNGNGDLMIGALGGYITSDMDFRKTGTRTSISGGTAGIYATYLNGGLFVDGVIKADFVDITQNTGFGTSGSRGNTSATTIGGIVDTGYRFQGQNYSYVEPLATIAYSNTDVDFMELLGNIVTFADGDNLLGRLGLRAGTSVAAGNGTYVEPFVTANVWNQFEGDTAATLESLGAADVKVKDDTSGASYQVGGGVEVRNTNGFSAFVKGHYQWGNDIEGGTARGGVRVNW